MYNARRPTSNNTITLTVIYYSPLDYGNGFDLKGCKCVFGNGREARMIILYRGMHTEKLSSRVRDSVNMWMLSLMLLERNKQGTRFIPNEWIRASIYQTHNKTMHSSFITFWAAVRSRAHSGQKCRRCNNFFAKLLFQLEALFKNKQKKKTLVCGLNQQIPLWFVWSTMFH